MNLLSLPAVIAFVCMLIIGPMLIPALTRLKFGQYIREDGPQAHQKKAGTPTMGGIGILAAFTIGCLCFIKGHTEVAAVLLVTWGFGLIGLLDDGIKVVLKHNEGLLPWQKFGLQIIFAILFAVYLMNSDVSTVILIPFIDKTWDMGWLYPIFVVIMMVGFNNGSNFTDGLDGLLSSVSVVICAFLLFVAVAYGEPAVAISMSAGIGALLGFLVFNTHPAKMFMGDTGALAIGAMVTSAAFMLRQPLILFVVAFIYLMEVASVILQVGYFKLTHGKRLFKMAPIHHHFELMGWPETKVVAIFTVITAALSMLALLGLA